MLGRGAHRYTEEQAGERRTRTRACCARFRDRFELPLAEGARRVMLMVSWGLLPTFRRILAGGIVASEGLGL